MRCRICFNSTSLLCDLGNQPMANKYPKNSGEFSEKNKMLVHICNECLTGQIGKVVSRSDMFEDYFYLSSVNKELNTHFENLAIKLKRSKFVLDIGSNDGVLLDPLIKLGVKCLGIDPSKNVGDLANKKGLPTIIDFFNEKSAKKIQTEYGCPEHVVCSSTFTHMDDPHLFAKGINTLSDTKTKLIIEVEYIKNIIENNDFERFYFDRPYYYSIKAFEKIFSPYGFVTSKVESIEAHGGSIQVHMEKNPRKISKSVSEMQKKESLFFKNFIKENFLENIKRNVKSLRDRLIKYKNDNKLVIGFGAPARLATITNFGDIGPELIKFVIDDNPIKAGRFSPGKLIPIKSREAIKTIEPDVILLFAYEYEKSIKKSLPQYESIFENVFE